MQHYYCFKAVHYILTDICFNNFTFGGLPIILSGDFAQILPVVPQGNRAAIIGACLQRLFLQPIFCILFLRLNMRVCQGEINQQFVAQVQDLSYNIALVGSITLLPGIGQFQSQKPFYGHIYLLQLLAQAYTTFNTFYDYTILTIRNNTVAKINKIIFMRLYGSLNTFHSINSIE